MSPDILLQLATQAGFEIIQSNVSSICKDEGKIYSQENLYYRRDLLAVLRKSP